jgi:hypothetical protein
MAQQEHGPDEDVDRKHARDGITLEDQVLRELSGEVEDVEDRAERVILVLGQVGVFTARKMVEPSVRQSPGSS